ncbi:uncharacterized protein troap [Vanacampus margaritifer]
MDAAPPVLREKNEDGFSAYSRRVKNENKMPLEPQNSKPLATLHLPDRDSENQDPESKTLVRPRVSRLPVLVKSQHPPAAILVTQWEETTLAGKDKRKKSRTRLKPFNISQHKSLKTDIVTLQPKSDVHTIPPKNNVFIKTQKPKEKPLKCSAVLKSTVAATKEKRKSLGTASGHSGTLKTENAAHHGSSSSSSSSSVSLDNVAHLTCKDPVRSENAQDNLSSHPCDKSSEFLPNTASLLSILRNEGVCVSSQSVATPRSQSCAMFPHKVSVTESRQKAAANQKEGVKAAGPMRATPLKPSRRVISIDTPQRFPLKKSLAAADKAVEFKPDSTALQSILRNEGVCISSQSNATPRSQSYAMFPQVSVTKSHQKAAASQKQGVTVVGPVRATPLKPSRRVTFINTPQRVPTKKSLAAAVSTHKEANNMLTPQRDSPPSPPMQVVQTLFVEEEDGQSLDKGKEEQLPVLQTSPVKTRCEDKTKMNVSCDDEKEQKIEEGQQSIQTLQRESVIVFSTGKKHCRFEKQESSARRELRGLNPSELEEVCKPVSRINLDDHIVDRDQKTCATNTAFAMLPKRLSLMDKQRLDTEVAFYFSHSISDPLRILPSQPRCSDPVASLLNFEESAKFVPLSLDAPSPCSSPLEAKGYSLPLSH